MATAQPKGDLPRATPGPKNQRLEPALYLRQQIILFFDFPLPASFSIFELCPTNIKFFEKSEATVCTMCGMMAHGLAEGSEKMERRYTPQEMLNISEAAELPIDKLIKAMGAIDHHHAEIDAQNRSTEEEREKINHLLTDLNGNVSADLTPLDILTKAGVRVNRGTKGYARRAHKQALLTYKPQAQG